MEKELNKEAAPAEEAKAAEAKPQEETAPAEEVKAIEVKPQEKATPKEEMVTIVIDPDNPITVSNMLGTKVYRGKVTVPTPIADDLLRIQAEYQEVVRGMHEVEPRITIKSRQQIESMYLFKGDGADPELGKLPRWMWNKLSQSAKDGLKELKASLEG